jgi:hypothetical protein
MQKLLRRPQSPRLRAREDGENPSPPRDCKAENFRREPLSHALNCSKLEFEAAMGRPRWTKPLSQETERNLNLGKYAQR